MGLFKRRSRPQVAQAGHAEAEDAEGIIREEIDGQSSVRFYCGERPTDAAIAAAGHEPSGYFWEGALRFLDPELADSMELDSEAGMFAAYGSPSQCDRVRELLSAPLSDPDAVNDLLRRAEATGHEFDD